MTFSTIFFPFVFLPACLLLYYIVPRILKNTVLVLCSLVFFAWDAPEYLPLMVCSILFSYFTGREMALLKANGKSRRAKATLISSVVVNLLLLCFYKYAGFLADNFNRLTGASVTVPTLSMPIGISFYTFTLLSYLFDIYREKAPVETNLIDFSVYVTFFPKLVSGPIVQYADMAEQIKSRTASLDQVGAGMRLFLIGLGKKVLLANTLGTTFYPIAGLPISALSTANAWLGCILYALMLYFDFSGYSDMAIGLGKMFGFRFAANFDYPYLSGSVSEFWRRWHISLGAWFRDYVYIPLGGSREGTAKTIRNLLIVWALTGIWHGANWTFVVWGMYYGLLLVLEKFVFRKLLDKLPGLFRHLLTLLLVLVGWVFFFSDSIGGAFQYLGRMFGAGAFWDSNFKYYFSSCWVVLLVGLFACLPVGAHIGSRVYRSKSKLPMVLSVLFFLAVLLLSVASMMNDTYSSFLYFQF